MNIKIAILLPQTRGCLGGCLGICFLGPFQEASYQRGPQQKTYISGNLKRPSYRPCIAPIQAPLSFNSPSKAPFDEARYG